MSAVIVQADPGSDQKLTDATVGSEQVSSCIGRAHVALPDDGEAFSHIGTKAEAAASVRQASVQQYSPEEEEDYAAELMMHKGIIEGIECDNEHFSNVSPTMARALENLIRLLERHQKYAEMMVFLKQIRSIETVMHEIDSRAWSMQLEKALEVERGGEVQMAAGLQSPSEMIREIIQEDEEQFQQRLATIEAEMGRLDSKQRLGSGRGNSWTNSTREAAGDLADCARKQGPLTTAFHENPTVVFVISSSLGLLAQHLLHATASTSATTVHCTLNFSQNVADSATETLIPEDYTKTKNVMRNLVSFSHAGARTSVTVAHSVATAVQEVAVAVVVPILARRGIQGLCSVGDSMISYAAAKSSTESE